MGGGGNPPYNFLLEQRKLNFIFLIIKSYKRYYLGSWRIKQPFYGLISNKKKIQKYNQVRKERLGQLQLALKIFKQFRAIYPQCKAWVESKEFKETYIDTKHPYPPLLNHETLNDENSPLNYKHISAELAWELNLPLPPNYNFMYIHNGSSASEATHRFLEKCNVKDTHNMPNYSPKGVFISHYNIFKEKECKKCFSGFSGGILSYLNRTFFTYRLPKQVPLLYIARDPIEKLQHAINHIEGEGYMGNVATLNLTCDYIKIAYIRQMYDGNTEFPTMKYLQNLSNMENMELIKKFKFACDSIFWMAKDKTTSIHCIEFNDLKPNKAFDTFCKIADTLGFDKPTNKEIFTNRINRNRGGLITLPTTLYAHADDLPNAFKVGQKEKQNLASLDKKGGFSIIVTLPHYVSDEQKAFADISDEIAPNCIIDDTRILIIIEKSEFAKLKENAELFNATKDYLKGYINALKENAEQIKANLISEEQILEFLRQNDEVRKNIKEILDNELKYIKQNHPEFIQKWKYYLEFEKMCAELDGTNPNAESAK